MAYEKSAIVINKEGDIFIVKMLEKRVLAIHGFNIEEPKYNI